MDTAVFENHESEVRGYCRSFPAVFAQASGAHLFDTQGKAYIDFFSGAGALNYGHNPAPIKRKLIEYLERGGITHSLDLFTEAKAKFLQSLVDVILKPRGLDYRVQFTGPTGTNAVESALKLARKVTGREGVISFTNAFHGMTLGSLSVTGSGFKRRGAGVPLHHTSVMPFDGYFGKSVDTLEYLAAFLEDESSGVDRPAAIILETLQAEGGLNTASNAWLRGLEALCREHEMLLIVDDVQVGCGRTGPFFSFERAGLRPDLVCLSKSLGGYGLPLAVTLIRPELDQWEPGEHNGTFRGLNPAFVTAAAALDYWRDEQLERGVAERAKIIRSSLEALRAKYPDLIQDVRGLGLLQGVGCAPETLAREVSRVAFENGLVMETSGAEGNVLKLMPPIVVEEDVLCEGLDRLACSFDRVAAGGDV